MPIHADALFVGVISGVIALVASISVSAITSRLDRIVGQLENANETLSAILDEVEK